MGLTFRRRKKLGHGMTLNMSGRGVSVSRKSGPLTTSSRGRGSLRLARGLSFRFKL